MKILTTRMMAVAFVPLLLGGGVLRSCGGPPPPPKTIVHCSNAGKYGYDCSLNITTDGAVTSAIGYSRAPAATSHRHIYQLEVFVGGKWGRAPTPYIDIAPGTAQVWKRTHSSIVCPAPGIYRWSFKAYLGSARGTTFYMASGSFWVSP